MKIDLAKDKVYTLMPDLSYFFHLLSNCCNVRENEYYFKIELYFSSFSAIFWTQYPLKQKIILKRLNYSHDFFDGALFHLTFNC